MEVEVSLNGSTQSFGSWEPSADLLDARFRASDKVCISNLEFPKIQALPISRPELNAVPA
jgi:hypothetical protein